MPVRRKIDRRRAEALPAWRMVFQSGDDFFDDLAEIGVATDKYGRPDRAEAEAAWHRFGSLFLAEWDAEQAEARVRDGREPWALREFGRPRRR